MHCKTGVTTVSRHRVGIDSITGVADAKCYSKPLHQLFKLIVEYQCPVASSLNLTVASSLLWVIPWNSPYQCSFNKEYCNLIHLRKRLCFWLVWQGGNFLNETIWGTHTCTSSKQTSLWKIKLPYQKLKTLRPFLMNFA